MWITRKGRVDGLHGRTHASGTHRRVDDATPERSPPQPYDGDGFRESIFSLIVRQKAKCGKLRRTYDASSPLALRKSA